MAMQGASIGSQVDQCARQPLKWVEQELMWARIWSADITVKVEALGMCLTAKQTAGSALMHALGSVLRILMLIDMRS
jgi:hypothetical protein